MSASSEWCCLSTLLTIDDNEPTADHSSHSATLATFALGLACILLIMAFSLALNLIPDRGFAQDDEGEEIQKLTKNALDMGRKEEV